MTLALCRIEGSYVPPGLWARGQTSARVPYTVPALYDLQDFAPVENPIESLIGKTRSVPQLATAPSLTYTHGLHDRVKARFRMLRRLPSDHDGEGAAAPNSKSIDRAIAFIDRIAKGPNFNATLDDDGSAVIEFEDRATGFFADITFRANGRVEFYKRAPGQESDFFEGEIETPEARTFLEYKIGLVV
jgi:hypothetical protein